MDDILGRSEKTLPRPTEYYVKTVSAGLGNVVAIGCIVLVLY